jgi:hypothetical protein
MNHISGKYPRPSQPDIVANDSDEIRRAFYKRNTGPDQWFLLGGFIGFWLFVISLIGVWEIAQHGFWDVAKVAGIASLVLGLATIFIIGGGNLAVKISRKIEERKQ